MISYTEIWMTVVGVSMSFSGVPQVVRILARKSAADISISMFSMLLFGQCWWLWYGFRISSPSIIIANFIAILINIFIISLAVMFRK